MNPLEPCRRRAIWAAKEKENEQNKARNDDDSLPEGDLDGSGRGRNHQTTVSAGTDEVERDKASPIKANANTNKPTAKKEMKACPKCGKKIGRGMYFHQKYCKG